MSQRNIFLVDVEAFGHKSGFLVLNRSIIVKFDLEDPFVINYVYVGVTWNQIPGMVVH